MYLGSLFVGPGGGEFFARRASNFKGEEKSWN